MQEYLITGGIIVLGLFSLVSPPGAPNVTKDSDNTNYPKTFTIPIRNMESNNSVGFVVINIDNDKTTFSPNTPQSSNFKKLVVYEGTCSNLGTIQYILPTERPEIREPVKDIIKGPPYSIVLEENPMDQEYCGEINISANLIS